ncbi:MAG TPA: 4'-phosphopantetheinyl transferase superfamily protein [Dongiaceae bacterium]|nr:4'-phosphopantetheinyl transferase superfamily protein [Dongiaceae bacterium]
MLDSLFPDPLLYQVAEPWMWETPVNSAEEALVEKAVEKRKREFRAGRHAAHALFRKVGIECPALLRGVQREPGWPAGWAGSISHTAGLCMAAIAPKDHCISLGVDAEQATPLNPDILDMICSKDEQAHLRDIGRQAGAGVSLDKLVFSAKESVHKTYFPLNEYTLDFLDARIELDWNNRRFEAFIINPEPNPRHPIKQLQGRFLFYREWIVTCITLPA